jgi:hypothetical protein
MLFIYMWNGGKRSTFSLGRITEILYIEKGVYRYWIEVRDGIAMGNFDPWCCHPRLLRMFLWKRGGFLMSDVHFKKTLYCIDSGGHHYAKLYWFLKQQFFCLIETIASDNNSGPWPV